MAGSKAYTVSLNVIGDTSGGQKSLDQMGSKAEKSAGTMSKAFSGVLGQLNSTGVLGPFGEAMEKAKEGFAKFGESGKSVGTAMLGVGTVAMGVGGLLTGLGSKEQQAQNQLKQAIENTGGAYEDFAGKIEKNVKSNEKFGHSSHDTMEAIRILTQATNSTDKALGDMGVAADLAAAKHISLSDAASLLAKVHGGSAKVLKAFGIDVSKAADNSKQLAAEQKTVAVADLAEAKAKQHLMDVHALLHGKTKLTTGEQINLRNAEDAVTTASGKAAEAHKKLADMHVQVTTKAQSAEENISKLGAKLDGQASAAANTFGGRLKALKTEIEDGAAKLGQKYGPALMGAGAGISMLGGLADGAGKILKSFGTATEAASTATDALAASETAELVPEGLALAPILLIIAAIALLGIGIYELVTHWKVVWGAIKDAAGAAWDFIKGIVSGAVDWIKGHWQLLVAILTGPIGLAVYFIKGHFNDILGFITGLPGRIASIASGMWHGISDGFRGMINSIIRLWNGLGFTLPSVDWGPVHLGGGHIQVPQIPYMAAGGVALGPTLAMIGEAGPEAVVPLDKAGEHGFGGGGGLTIPLTLELDGRVVAQKTVRYTRDELIRMRKSNPTGPSL